MGTSLSASYRVRKDDTLTLKLTIGQAKIGVTDVSLEKEKMLVGKEGSFDLPLGKKGSEFKGKTLYVTTSVAVIPTPNSKISVTYELTGGPKPFKQTLEEDAKRGEVVTFEADLDFYM